MGGNLSISLTSGLVGGLPPHPTASQTTARRTFSRCKFLCRMCDPLERGSWLFQAVGHCSSEYATQPEFAPVTRSLGGCGPPGSRLHAQPQGDFELRCGRTGAPSSGAYRVGQRDSRWVDPQDRWTSPERFRNGGQDRRDIFPLEAHTAVTESVISRQEETNRMAHVRYRSPPGARYRVSP